MRLCYSIVLFMSLVMLSSGIGLIAGCGQKGALYLPAEPAQQAKKQAAKKSSTDKTQTEKNLTSKP